MNSINWYVYRLYTTDQRDGYISFSFDSCSATFQILWGNALWLLISMMWIWFTNNTIAEQFQKCDWTSPLVHQ